MSLDVRRFTVDDDSTCNICVYIYIYLSLSLSKTIYIYIYVCVFLAIYIYIYVYVSIYWNAWRRNSICIPLLQERLPCTFETSTDFLPHHIGKHSKGSWKVVRGLGPPVERLE